MNKIYSKPRTILAIALLAICAICFVATILAIEMKFDAYAQDVNASKNSTEVNKELVPLVEGEGHDYIFTKYYFDGTKIEDPSVNSDFCMFNVYNRDAMKTWDEFGNDRFWILEKDCVLKNKTDQYVNAHFLMKFDQDDDERCDRTGYLYITCTDDSGNLIPMSLGCVLTDGSKATYKIEENNSQPVKNYRMDIKYEISKIAYIQLQCANTTTHVDELDSQTGTLLDNYDKDFEDNPTLDFCLSAENDISSFITEIKSDPCWEGYLNRRLFKLESLDFKNVENARNVITPEKYKNWAEYLSPGLRDKADRSEKVAAIYQLQIDNIDAAISKLNTWLSSLESKDKYSIVNQYQDEIDALKSRLDYITDFSELYEAINDYKFLSFIFDREANSNGQENVALAEERVTQAINLYRTYGHQSDDFKAIVDVKEYIAESATYNQAIANCWDKVFDKWLALNKDENYVNINTVPSGLPNDGTMCIAVHGFKLNDDGSPQQEYINRLDMALKTWQTYPNSYIAIMGGGTAKDDPKITEARVGANYLLSKGVPSEKLILEDKSTNTIENVGNLFKMLCDRIEYTNIDKICVCSSDYHIRRCATLWEGKCICSSNLPEIYNDGVNRNINLVSNVSSKTEKDIWTEAQDSQGLWLIRLLMYPDYSGSFKALNPSTFVSIETPVNQFAYLNEKYTPVINATFMRDNKVNNAELNDDTSYTYTIDVADICDIYCDTSKLGVTTCVAKFQYDATYEHIEKTLYFPVTVIERPVPPEPPSPDNPEITNAGGSAQTGDNNFYVFASLAIIALVCGGFATRKYLNYRNFR